MSAINKESIITSAQAFKPERMMVQKMTGRRNPNNPGPWDEAKRVMESKLKNQSRSPHQNLVKASERAMEEFREVTIPKEKKNYRDVVPKTELEEEMTSSPWVNPNLARQVDTIRQSNIDFDSLSKASDILGYNVSTESGRAYLSSMLNSLATTTNPTFQDAKEQATKLLKILGKTAAHPFSSLASKLQECRHAIADLFQSIVKFRSLRFKNQKSSANIAYNAMIYSYQTANEMANSRLIKLPSGKEMISYISDHVLTNVSAEYFQPSYLDGVVGFSNTPDKITYYKSLSMFGPDSAFIETLKIFNNSDGYSPGSVREFSEMNIDMERIANSCYSGVGDVVGQMVRTNAVFEVYNNYTLNANSKISVSQFNQDYFDSHLMYDRSILDFFISLIYKDGKIMRFSDWDLALSRKVRIKNSDGSDTTPIIGIFNDLEGRYFYEKVFDYNSVNIKGQAGPGFKQELKGDNLNLIYDIAWDAYEIFDKTKNVEPVFQKYPFLKFTYMKPKDEVNDLVSDFKGDRSIDSFKIANAFQEKIRTIWVNSAPSSIALQKFLSVFDSASIDVFTEFKKAMATSELESPNCRLVDKSIISLKGFNRTTGAIDILAMRVQNLGPFKNSPKTLIGTYSDNLFYSGILGEDIGNSHSRDTASFNIPIESVETQGIADMRSDFNVIPSGTRVWISLDGGKMEASSPSSLVIQNLERVLKFAGCPVSLSNYFTKICRYCCTDSISVFGNQYYKTPFNQSGSPTTFLNNDMLLYAVARLCERKLEQFAIDGKAEYKKNGKFVQFNPHIPFADSRQNLEYLKSRIFPNLIVGCAEELGVQLKFEKVTLLPAAGTNILTKSNIPIKFDLLGYSLMKINLSSPHPLLENSFDLVVPILESKRIWKSLVYRKREKENDADTKKEDTLSKKCLSLALEGGIMLPWVSELLLFTICHNEWEDVVVPESDSNLDNFALAEIGNQIGQIVKSHSDYPSKREALMVILKDKFIQLVSYNNVYTMSDIVASNSDEIMYSPSVVPGDMTYTLARYGYGKSSTRYDMILNKFLIAADALQRVIQTHNLQFGYTLFNNQIATVTFPTDPDQLAIIEKWFNDYPQKYLTADAFMAMITQFLKTNPKILGYEPKAPVDRATLVYQTPAMAKVKEEIIKKEVTEEEARQLVKSRLSALKVSESKTSITRGMFAFNSITTDYPSDKVLQEIINSTKSKINNYMSDNIMKDNFNIDTPGQVSLIDDRQYMVYLFRLLQFDLLFTALPSDKDLVSARNMVEMYLNSSNAPDYRLIRSDPEKSLDMLKFVNVALDGNLHTKIYKRLINFFFVQSFLEATMTNQNGAIQVLILTEEQKFKFLSFTGRGITLQTCYSMMLDNVYKYKPARLLPYLEKFDDELKGESGIKFRQTGQQTSHLISSVGVSNSKSLHGRNAKEVKSELKTTDGSRSRKAIDRSMDQRSRYFD